MLYLTVHRDETYAHMSALLGISKSTAHDAVARLERAGLIHRLSDRGVRVAHGPALEFLLFGVPYAFAPETVPRARGVLTGLAAPGAAVDSETPEGLLMVWPSRLGDQTGIGIKPLVPAAPDTALRDPALYQLFALVDALRMGDVREREYARRAMRAAFDRARM